MKKLNNDNITNKNKRAHIPQEVEDTMRKNRDKEGRHYEPEDLTDLAHRLGSCNPFASESLRSAPFLCDDSRLP